MILQILLGAALTCAASPAGQAWTLVHTPEIDDYGYTRFALRGGRIFALPGLSTSDDGGATWVDRDFLGDFTDADFPSSSNWLGAQLATADLLRSSNEGEDWEPLHASTTPIHVVRFFDAARGFAVGEAIIRTEDGGRTWAWAADLPRNPLPNPRATCVLDGKRAWTAAEEKDSIRIWRTEDAGKHFEALGYVFAGQPRALTFVDKKNGWLLANVPSDSRQTLSKSTDGGKSWSLVPMPARSKGGLTAVAFRDEDEGWVGGPGGLLHTKDGGNNWETWAIPDIPDADDVGLHYGKAKDGRYLLLGTLKHETEDSDDGMPLRFTTGKIYRLRLK